MTLVEDGVSRFDILNSPLRRLTFVPDGSRTRLSARSAEDFCICFLFLILWGGTLGTAATTGLFVPAPDDRWWWLWRNWWNEDWQGRPKYSEETCLSATLSTANPTWLDPGLNPGSCGGNSLTNRLSYGAASARDFRPISALARIPRQAVGPVCWHLSSSLLTLSSVAKWKSCLLRTIVWLWSSSLPDGPRPGRYEVHHPWSSCV
jgi:hypothetical protein